MFALALKSVFARKRRLIGTALAVTLGIAFLAGTLVFTDTIRRTFDDLFADIYDDTDTMVRSAASVEMQFGGEQRGRIPDSTVDLIRSVGGVAEVQPVVQAFAQLVDADGDAIGNPGQGAPTFGMNYFGGPLSPWELTPGSEEPGTGELVVTKGSADAGHLEIGDDVTVLTQTGPHVLRLVGTARFDSADSPGGASAALFDLATAQEVLLGAPGKIDAVMARAVEGVSEETLTSRIAAALPDGLEALTGTQITEETQDQVAEQMSFFNTFLMVFAAVGLVVACFTIFNTFQIIVTQRFREMALLRAIGATRRQVLSSQLGEATLVGLVASAVGLALGVAVARLLKALLGVFGVDIPAGGTAFLPRTAVVALVVGTIVTVGAAVFPAIRASRIPPIAALRDVSLDRSGQSWRRLGLGATVTVGGVAAFVAGLAGSGIGLVGLGTLLTFIGAFILGPLVARPVAGALGAPLGSIAGFTGVLARENAMRSPKRTARTGGALMVGVALVAGITIIAASLKDWIRDVFDEQFAGDYVVSTDTFDFGGLSPDLAAQLNELPEVEAATGIRVGLAKVVQEDTDDKAYVAVDPDTAGEIFDIGMIEGSIEALDDSGVLIHDDEAGDRGLVVGDTLHFQFLNGSTRQLMVRGIYTDEELAGEFVVTQALHEQSGSDQFDFSVYVTTRDGVDDDAALRAIGAVSNEYANAELLSREEYLDQQAAQIDPLVNLIYALLALAIGIALFSIANSMALSIHERTREMGLLRAVGMTRRQTRATVRWESVLISLLGTGFGLALGVFFGWSISVTVRDDGLGQFAFPAVSLIAIATLAVIGGLLASLRPARKAARLDVLRAIATE